MQVLLTLEVGIMKVMYRQPPKRQQAIRRAVIYSIMSVIVVALVAILIFIMLGYQFNRSDGKIEQGGLVQFDSKPTGANVSIDGASFGSQTSSKTTLTAGQHFVTMSRSGYKTWQKSVNVVPGTVLWLNYTRLIPNDLKPSTVTQFSSVSGAIASPDDKWMAIKEEASTPIIKLADISQETPKISSLSLPINSYTHPSAGKSEHFVLEKWDPNSRYIVVKHAYDDTKSEWLIVDSQDVARTKNITKLLDIDVSKLVFNGSNSSLLYVLIGTDLRKIDIDAATLSRPLVSNVADFSLYDNSTLAYTTLLTADTKSQSRSVGYYEDGADTPFTIRTYQDDGKTPLKISIGKYFSDIVVAINYGDEVSILKGKLPTATNPSSTSLKRIATMNISGGAQYLSIKTNGRFVIAQNGATFENYDVELQKMSKASLKGSAEYTKEMPWLDNYMIWSDRDNILRFYEFDGSNQQDIMPVTSGLGVSLSPNSKYIYGILKESDTVYRFERVKLILS